MANNIIAFPPQKIPTSKKNKAWAKRSMDAAITISNDNGSVIRQSMYNKRVNYDLANGIVDMSDVERVFNPMGIKASSFPTTPQNYQIEIPNFNLLVGEEATRRFDWKVRVLNHDSISAKEEEQRSAIFKAMLSE